VLTIRNGTPGNDTLNGSLGGNVDDVLNGGLGDDLYQYTLGSGNDVINDTGGIDSVQLGDPLRLFTDWKFYRSGNDLLMDFYGQGRVTVTDQFLLGLPVVEVLGFSDGGTPYSFSNSLTGAAGNDVLIGTSSAETITGNGGDDLIFGHGGNDTLFGGDGDDELHGGAGNNTINGGVGWDSAEYGDLAAGVTVNFSGLTKNISGHQLADGHVLQASGAEDVLTGIEAVSGSAFADVFYDGGTTGYISFFAGAGNDTFHVGGGTGNSYTNVEYNWDLHDRVIVNLSNAGITVDGVTVASKTARDGYGDTDSFVLSGNHLSVTGSASNDYLRGQDDIGGTLLDGDAGNDTIVGGALSDFVGYFSEDEALFGAIVNLSASAITVNGVAGHTGDVTVNSNQALDQHGNTDTLINIHMAHGSRHSDYLIGSSAANTLFGNEGDDILYGGGGNDYLSGGAGADTLVGGAGGDTLDGGAITDRINGADFNLASYVSSTAGVTVNLGAGAGVGNGSASDGFGGTDTLININLIRGSDFADSITGSVALVLEQIEGGLGNDTLNGGAITDTLNQNNNNRVSYQNAGGAVSVDLAAGTASGAAGNDTLINFSQIRGSAYNDTLLGSDSTQSERFEGLAGDDSIDGRGGFDDVAYDRSTSAVNVNLATGTASDGFGGTDTLSHIEGIRGSAYHDVLTGGLAANGTSVSDGLIERFIGNAGNDTIDGGQGYDRVDYTTSPNGVIVTLNDTLEGSASDGFGGTDTLRHIEGVRGSAYNDTLTGSDSATFESFEGREGNDQIDGKGGVDRVDYTSSMAGVIVNLLTGTVSDGFGGTDTLANIENVRGSRDFNDSITGSTANNKLEGLGGNDTLDGGVGADTMIGGDGSDSYYVDNAGDLVGESNADFAIGGNDIVYSTLAAYTLTANVERLRLMLAGASNGTGNALDNTLYAGDGDNVLDGAAGNDTVSYVFASAGVTVSLASAGAQATGGSGTDTLISIENLICSGFNDNLTGNIANNVLDGGAGSDFLNGATGADTMLGGDGTDSYAVDHAGDLVSESNGSLAIGGNDVVYSYLAAYTLPANVERLRLMLVGASNGTGNALDNTLYAADGNNVLDGAAGNDIVSYSFATAGVTLSLATAGAQATGGSGSDTLISIENLTGSGFNDSLTGNIANNVLDGGAGSDFLNGATGADTMLGGDGNDSYAVDHAGDLVSESNGSLATGGNDIVYSYLAAYTLTANVERLRLMLAGASNGTGNALDNTLYAGDGNNVLDGAAGNDTVSYAFATAGVNLNLATAGAQATGGSASDTLISIENLIGSGFNDSLIGNTANNVLNGGAGSDFLNGATGADTMLGGDGTDSYAVDHAGDLVTESNSSLATGGNDIVYSYLATYTLTANVERLRLMLAGASNASGNGLDNTLYAGAGNNVLDGAAGNDTVSYAFATAGVTLSLATAGAQATGGSASDTLISIEHLIGSGFNDNFTGNTANNVLDGGAGSDFLNGATGADTMLGGDGTDSYCVDHAGDIVSESNGSLATGGNDIVYSYFAAYTLTANVERLRLMLAGASNGTGNALDNTLYAGDGNNVLDGVSGVDTASYQFATAAVSVSLATTAAQATGGSGSDTLQNFDNLVGSNFHDTLVGDAHANTLNGLALNDYLDGGAGNDVLLGGDGTDLLIGGLGQDLLTGGAGSDTFDFNALDETGLTNTTWDVISDFVHGMDKIDLAMLDADTALAGDQAFTDPVLGGTFSGVFASPGDLYFDTVAHVLYGNTDADTAAEFAIQLVGVATLTAADLFL
jgi:Ca2+-binding RTX toxin-like protein